MNSKSHPGPEVRERRRYRGIDSYESGWLEVVIAEALAVNKGTVSRRLSVAKEAGRHEVDQGVSVVHRAGDRIFIQNYGSVLQPGPVINLLK